MIRRGFFVAGLLLAYAAQPTKASVVWDFLETGITCPLGNCALPPQPYTLMSLTLPQLTSSGSARWQGGPGPAPVYTGDAFTLTTRFGTLTSDFAGSDRECGGVPRFCRFNIFWTANGAGIQITIDLLALNDSIGPSFNQSGGFIASDGPGGNGGCIDSSCRVTGYFVDADEPLNWMVALLIIPVLLSRSAFPIGKNPA